MTVLIGEIPFHLNTVIGKMMREKYLQTIFTNHLTMKTYTKYHQKKYFAIQ